VEQTTMTEKALAETGMVNAINLLERMLDAINRELLPPHGGHEEVMFEG
jgi:hypothetical protein